MCIRDSLDIVPAINKIDLPSAHPDEVKEEIEEDLAIPADDAVCVSGKTGEGIHCLLYTSSDAMVRLWARASFCT